MILRIHHISIGVKGIEERIIFYRDRLGLELKEKLSLPGVNLGLIDAGNGQLELLEPADSQSDLAREIAEKGEGLHHICLEVDDLEAQLKSLKKAGVKVDEVPRQTPLGKIAFIHPQSTGGVLIELLQRP